MRKVQKNVVTVLKRMVASAEKDAGDAEMFSEGLENMLDDIHMDDGFGTEGQCDPRGDSRNGKWSIFTKVEDQ
jgi:hypothetical protein